MNQINPPSIVTRASSLLLLAVFMVLFMAMAGQVTPVYAATINVDDDLGVDNSTCGSESSPCRTISYAISTRAVSGDTVYVWAGTYTQQITLRAGISVIGEGASVTFIDGENARGPMVSASGSAIGSSTVLQGLTIRRGLATNGGGISLTGGASPLIADCVVSENRATGTGGGLYVFNSASFTLSGTQVIGNRAANRGGGLYQSGSTSASQLHMLGCRIENNSVSSYDGGGLWILGSVTMTETQVISNTARVSGGGLFQGGTGGRAEIHGGRFERNTAATLLTSLGGGLHVAGSAVLSDAQIISNTSAFCGGGLWANYAQVNGGLFAHNMAGQRGGGLYVTQSVVMTATQVIRNISLQRGGGLYSERAFEVVNSLVVGNAAFAGAGLYSYGAESTVAIVRHSTVVSPTISYSNPTAAAILIRAGTTGRITNTIIGGYPYGIEATQGTVYEDYNLYYSNGVRDFNQNGGPVYSGGHSLFDEDPSFVNAAGDDYHIDTDSAALDAGTFLGVADDWDQDSRPTNSARADTPDIGYDENKELTVMRVVTDSMTFGTACAHLVFTDTGALAGEYITVTATPGEFPTADPANKVVSRTVVITPEVSAEVSAALTLCYEENEAAGLDESRLVLWRWDGERWQRYPSTVDTVNNVVTGGRITAFSRWLIGEDDAFPTAVELVYFLAQPSFGGILLEWETATEIDNLGFNLFRADSPQGDKVRVNDILIPSQSPGAPIGAVYQFVDRAVEPGHSYYYWLEDVDIYGQATRHGPVSAMFNSYQYYLPLIGK